MFFMLSRRQCVADIRDGDAVTAARSVEWCKGLVGFSRNVSAVDRNQGEHNGKK